MVGHGPFICLEAKNLCSFRIDVMIKDRFFFPPSCKEDQKKNVTIPFACGSAVCFEMSMFFSSEQMK